MKTKNPYAYIKDWPMLLEQIRRKPGNWLGQPSLIALNHFIGGIGVAESIHGIAKKKRLGGFPWEEFEKWAHERFNPHRLSIRSFDMALRSTNSDEEAFSRWFEWYDQFNSEREAIASNES